MITAGTVPAPAPAAQPRPVALDPYRAFVFPNRIRELRRRQGFPKLLKLAAALPDIPYIRLSKIERGEVFARPEELVRIAGVLQVAPAELLVDVDAPAFDMADWAEPFYDPAAVDADEERFAVKLAAALRARRAGDRSLTVAVLDKEYGLPPVILSRLENAHKTLDRWNGDTVRAVQRVLGVVNAPALRTLVEDRYRSGALDPFLHGLGSAEARLEKTRARITALAEELAGGAAPAGPASGFPQPPEPAGGLRLLPVLGTLRADGALAPTPLPGQFVEAPRTAGPRAFALRMCRPCLGPRLPGSSVLVADPDVYPSAGLAVLRQDDGYRVLAVTSDRSGAPVGFSLYPELEVRLDGRDPGDLAAVIAALFP